MKNFKQNKLIIYKIAEKNEEEEDIIDSDGIEKLAKDLNMDAGLFMK